ncbi:hypothetical protein COCVIDRAFT_96571 [Bipolaris victoriae FI3]|uniref:Phosphatidate cytidylyltransferase n=1 Tax=Bipolaris victoriae (strain FI3) TaxID=930091 RepID=W7EC79_BIPV3|nr:hypothetical protein COCVIDRAFT_96571 [Bipolaris victoriae FI3]
MPQGCCFAVAAAVGPSHPLFTRPKHTGVLKATLPHDSCDTHTQPRPLCPESSGPRSLLVHLALLCSTARSTLSGVIRTPAFPYFPVCWRVAMESSRQYQVPHTPRVISPSPTPSEAGSTRDGYFGPVTRSATRKQRVTSPPPIDEDSSGSDPDQRARTRSRSPAVAKIAGRRRMSALASRRQMNGVGQKELSLPGDTANGHLSPAAANKNYWREMSRSPSPLGLIPIHQKWRSFIHRHEIPRKILHVSIGFLTIFLYCTGTQTSQIHNVLLTLLVPIALTDVIRHRYWQVNRLYIRFLGALMRESEVDGYNGVISYLLGAWIVMRFCPKDIAVMSILLLSWCDTAASTFGRLWGHLTPRVRKGKSLAGSIAACVTGVITAAVWWGWLGPTFSEYNHGEHAFAFQGALTLPLQAREQLNLSVSQASVTGHVALGVMSLAAGIIASTSEAIDVFGWDDNLTIPVLCGAGLWGFVKMFG